MIKLFQPYVCHAAKENVMRILDSSWLGMGPECELFEKEFAEYIGCKHAISMNSATAALQVALHARPNTHRAIVLTTPNTFVATNHVIVQEGLVPYFIDIDPNTGAMDPEVLATYLAGHSRFVEAIMVVHYAGNPVDLDRFREIATKYGIYMIEDAAHATGAMYDGKKIGADSIAACFSFHAVKNLATGDGGMLVTSDDQIATRARKLRWFGIDKSTADRTKMGDGTYAWEYNVESLGWKCHMNDITAALGRGQLTTLDMYNDIRRDIWKRYRDRLENTSVTVLQDTPRGVSSRHLMVVRVPGRAEKEKALECLKKADIQFGYHYKPNYLYPPYRFYQPIMKRGMEEFYDTAISLPMHPFLRDCDIDRICEVIR